MTGQIDRKAILTLIRNGQISPENGLALLRSAGAPAPEPAVAPAHTEAEAPKPAPAPACAPVSEIAVIGMSGRFPGAENLDEFWRNLCAGVDSVTEVPPSRWNMAAHYDPEIKTPRKTYCKWSGMLSRIDQFDPLFFGITPKEAELMDPQQRIFLEEAWKAMEDAGYAPEALSGRKCGVFAGLGQADYAASIRATGSPLDSHFLLGSASSVLAARIAYVLNLTGPSMAIDTACSSSLVAIHQACQSIASGESEMALAGGVCAFATPEMHITTSKGGMLSKTGKCRAFDNEADGFVPSEGVGLVVLKALPQALADGDQIYGVIRGWGMNQDGRTNGMTAPSASSQTRLLTDVYGRYGINPDQISYVEAHGTGTKLGDPIEVSALTNAFRQHTDRRNYCAIGSVKSNIGHTLSAAGVASLIKVLLCLRHRKLVPSLHVRKLNEHIDFDNSPFYVSAELKDWAAPRLAAVSAFGLSGTNCHLVVAEAPSLTAETEAGAGPWLVPLSAKTEQALLQRIRDLALWLEGAHGASLGQISYTLMTGRGHFSHRCAIIATDLPDLKATLARILMGERCSNALMGRSQEHGAAAADQPGLYAVARRYAGGGEIKWDEVAPAGRRYRRISLPTYPFAKMVCWHPGGVPELPGARLHPLIAANTSTFDGQRYSVTLTGEEFFLTDHLVAGEKTVPGAALMEMARAAAELAAGRTPVRLKSVFFLRPAIVAAGPLSLHAVLTPTADGGADFAIQSGGAAGEELVHARGSVTFSPADDGDRVDIEAIRRRCGERIARADCYSRFRAMGVTYGPSFQGIAELLSGEEEALAKVELQGGTPSGFVLHPALLDGALQTVLGVGRLWSAETTATYLPFALDELEVRAPLPETCYVHAVLVGGSHSAQAHRFDLRITGADGRLVARLQGYAIRPLGQAAEPQEQVLYFGTRWAPAPLTARELPKAPLLVVGSAAQRAALALDGALSGRPVTFAFPGDRFSRLEDGAYQFRPDEISDCERLTEALGLDQAIPRQILLLADVLPAAADCPNVHLLLGLTQALMKAKTRRVEILYAFTNPAKAVQPYHWAVSGFARSLVVENPNFTCRVVEMGGAIQVPVLLSELADLAAGAAEIEIRYDGAARMTRACHEVQPGALPAGGLPLRRGGVCLITGGAGGLGLLFARDLFENSGARLVLVGRSPLNAQQQRHIDKLKADGAEVTYLQADVSDPQQVRELVARVKALHGGLHGVIHSAGQLRDAYILHKTPAEMAAVLAPKVGGCLALDAATADEPLDFFVLFSAIASVVGNVGQCDYAFANAYLDRFAELRSQLVQDGRRSGKSVAINWPLWREGGMQITEETARWLRKRLGMGALSSAAGLAALPLALRSGASQLVVIAGDAQPVRAAFLGGAGQNPGPAPDVQPEPAAAAGSLLEQTQRHLQEVFAKVTGMPLDALDLHESLTDLGIDSIIIVGINDELETCYGGLPKTLLFEYKTIADLAAYLVENHRDVVAGYQARLAPIPAPAPAPGATPPVAVVAPTVTEVPDRGARRDEIAIVGLSGRYPMAADLDQFWELLKAGRDCITEIPAERWDHSRYFDSDKERPGKSYAKWGGFIDDVDKFDPLFFNIAPREAELMDPQERLFLESAWQAVEDAGYTRTDLARQAVGVFVGVMYSHYQLVALEEQLKGGTASSTSCSAAIANRVSYCLNLNGPSVALDTMCSSSLTAIHLACSSIKSGDCDMAIAGGVNLTIHPGKYLLLSQGKFAASDGRCRSFGEGGDGYVPGEGVGALVLKPLARALADGDHIYGVIKGSAVNHGGKTNGFTVPNPHAQADVITGALERSGVDPRTISFLEAHGTGTSLGDPIEIRGLSKAYSAFTSDRHFCAIGSVKSNIGHLESASGIAAVTKVLLQMQHKQLAPSIHADTLNPNIDFSASPFYVQRELAAWQRPAGGPPRRAGVSAFGAGGANAHLIIEEYEPAQAGPVSEEGEQHLFVLSARTEERLQEYARRLAAHLERRYLPAGGAPLSAIAYTLQVGREPLEVRLATLASSLPELLQSLRAYGEGRPGSECISGMVRQRPAQTASLADLMLRRDLTGLAKAWVQGDEVDWRSLYPAAPGRISLPAYPFARKRYWLGDQKLLSAVAPATLPAQVAAPAPAEVHAASPAKPGAPDWERLAAGYDGDEVTLQVIDGQVALVTMQDRQHKNMFSDRIITGLVARFAEIRRNPAIKAVVLTGYDHVFSMGGTQQQLIDIADSKSSFTDAPFLYRGLLELEIPVVSAIQGHASGGGLLFGLYADIIIMSEESVYSAVFMKYGFTPGMGATFLLKEKLGTNLATEMMFTARSFRGEELKQRGASVIFRPGAEVLPEALTVARLLAEKPIHALRVLKKELAGRILAQLPAHIERESQMHAQTFSHPEVKERIGHYFLSGRTQAEPAARGPALSPQSQRLQLKRRPPQAEPEAREPAPSPQPVAVPTVDVRQQITAIVCQILRLTPADLRPAATFQELGADSISGLEIVRDINKAFQLNLEAVVLYDYPTIDLMAEHVMSQAPRLAAQAALAAAAPALAVSAPAPAVVEPVSRPAVASPVTGPAQVDGTKVLADVCTAVGRILRLDQSELNIEATFQALGTDSISGVEIVRDLNRIFHLNLDAVVLYDYPSPAQLAEHIRSQLAPTGRWGTEPEQPKPAAKSSRLIGLDVKEYEKYRERDTANKTVALAPAGRAVVQVAHGADAAGDAPQAPAAAPPKQRLQLTSRSPREPEEEETDKVTPTPAKAEGVAIIGMSGRFPGAPNLQQFWANLKNGVESITEVPPERWDAEAWYDPAPRAPGKSYSKVGGFLAETDRFDPLFFNISPLEAETMDPQQRIFLEEAWSALEDAGYSAESLSGAHCGVFVGAARGDFARAMAPSGADYSGDAFTGLAPSILAARISYWLNLKGPSLALDTACSSSLVAIHLACQSIRAGESDMALAGGVRLMLTPEMHIQTSQLSILSPTGRCRAFDQQADGTILSEGVGVVVLKPLSKALADGDHIYGVIRASGVNQDGKTNGITAPSAQSQTDLELSVYRRAGIDPAAISYIETHGTGTKLGDPIEIKALKNAFAAFTSKRRFCAIGSVKTNIGHATMAAGVASVIKVLLAMKHRQIPPSLHFNQPNEHINFPETPFYVNTELTDWRPPEGGRRLAAVSSFGFSGTNCHLVIEEAPAD